MRRFLLLGLAAHLSACASTGGGAQDVLQVGAAKVEITPAIETYEDLNLNGHWEREEPFKDLNGNGKWDPVYLAGFSIGRTAVSVRDPLWVRAVVFEKAGTRVALVSCDLIGLFEARLARVISQLKGAHDNVVDHVVLCSTHVHSGPDTLGLWGPFPGISGVSPDYFESVERAVLRSVVEASRAVAPATIVAADVEVRGVCKDTRAPDVRNETASALLARDRQGRPLAVMANFAMHPEAMGSKNRAVTSDFAHPLRVSLEKEFPGAMAVFFSGDLGGMQTPDVRGGREEETRRCGETIASALSRALLQAPPMAAPDLKFATRQVEFPLENRRFVAAFKAGVFGKDLPLVEKEGRFTVWSQVSAVRVGDVLFAAVPGEAFPEVGREIRALMNARHRILLGLAHDEIGYILPKEDFDPKKYEESMSLGPETAPTLLDAMKQLLKGF